MKPNSKSCVLFDLGNTLVGSVDLATWPNDLALPMYSIEHQPVGYESTNLGAEIKRHIKNAHSNSSLKQLSWEDAWGEPLAQAGFSADRQMVERICRAHLTYALSTVNVFDYAIPLLKYLKNRRIPVALVSNVTGPPDMFDQFLVARGIGRYITYAAWSSRVGVRKPSHLPFIDALTKLSCRAEDAIVVGDDEIADIVPGNALGATTVLISDKECGSAAKYCASKFNVLDVIAMALDSTQRLEH